MNVFCSTFLKSSCSLIFAYCSKADTILLCSTVQIHAQYKCACIAATLINIEVILVCNVLSALLSLTT